jgi:arsenate reductase
MAEALLRQMAGDRFEIHSAGTTPTEVHPMTRQVLAEIGTDASGLEAKGVDRFLGKVALNFAIIVCAKAQESCPRIYPFAVQTLYWPFDDPAAFEGSGEERLQKFRAVRDEIGDRIRVWLTELPPVTVG